MKRATALFAISILYMLALCPQALAQELLIPGGQVIGLELCDNSVTVAALDDVTGSCARDAGLEPGDTIVAIDGSPITCARDVQQALEKNPGQVRLTILRKGRQRQLLATPARTADGPRLGVYLRQGISGIGTVTYYHPDTGEFGALGHGVSDPQGGLLQMRWGNAFPARVFSVKQGKIGQPGQLRGDADAGRSAGTLAKNTPQGVFGTAGRGQLGQPLPLAEYGQIQVGPATIRSTVQGDTPREYSVEILKIYPKDRSDHRNLLLRVTDPALLEVTGGIVQGMSGSPIIQDGRLIGAVTHVLVNDPTTGYGIFIDNMLDAAA